MSYQSKFTGEEIDAAVNEAKALIGKSVVYCSTATVGQILEVAEVDENGKPTKWKTVDKPSSGVPDCSTEDNGKFLRVVSGKPAWASIPSAEEASF